MVKIPEWYTSVSEWPGLIAEVVTMDIESIDADSIRHLAGNIVERWRETANSAMDPTVEFERLYKANEHNAKAAIVAILELVKTVGAGEPLRSGTVLEVPE